MGQNERDFAEWLVSRCGRLPSGMTIPIGDDMGGIPAGSGQILVSSDMLLDGVHFDSKQHSFAMVGRKAAACNLSDCAAMAVRPLGVVVSLALPKTSGLDDAKAIMEGVIRVCEQFDCVLIGGDTTRWNHALVIDVAIVAEPYPGIDPIRRSEAEAGDRIFVTGPLGGSIRSRHMTFTPRVNEARKIASELGGRLHAMMDISDGLGIDLDRMMNASNTGAVLERSAVLQVASPDLRDVESSDDGLIEHVLSDGEDYELLIAADVNDAVAGELGLTPLGVVTERKNLMLKSEGTETQIEPGGWQHF